MRAARVVLVAAVVLAGVVTWRTLPAGAAGTWYVATTGSDGNDCQSAAHPCATVAAALAKVVDGATVTLAAGTYTETVTLTRDVTLAGASLSATVLEAAGQGTALTVVAGTTALVRDLTMQDGMGHQGPVQAPFAGFSGGGVQNDGTLTLERVQVLTSVAVCQNCVGGGGGINNTGMLTVTDSVVAGNAAPAGGGVFNTGTARIIRSSITDNNGLTYGGGGLRNHATLLLDDSTVARNAGSGLINDGPGGGGLPHPWPGGVATIRQSTLSTNAGWGIETGGVLTMTASTVGGNTPAPQPHPQSGGLSIAGGSVALSNTIITNNTPRDCAVSATLPPAVVVYGGINAVGSQSTCPPLPQRAAVYLAPLQDNGGPTETMLPQGVDAIGAVPHPACVDETGTPYTTDQRGDPRPLTAACAIGAVELQPAEIAPSPSPAPVSTGTPPPTATQTATPRPTPTPGTVTLALATGWTLVAFPLVPATPLHAQDVLAAVLQSSGGSFAELAQWTGAAWTTALRDHGTPNGDFLITPAAGYFLYTDAPGQYVLTGQSAATAPQASHPGAHLAGMPHSLPPRRHRH